MPSGELLLLLLTVLFVFAGGQEEYVLSYEPVSQQEGESELYLIYLSDALKLLRVTHRFSKVLRLFT